MTMAVDGGDGDDLRAEINVTPLVDVMLVLLVIFMVVTPLLQQQFPIDLPTTRTSTEAPESSQVHLLASADGSLRLNDQPISKEELAPAMQTLYATRSERTIFLEADRSLNYAAVVELMDACRAAGVDRIGIVTSKESGGETRVGS
jgi:biopolymer transport protein ExbD